MVIDQFDVYLISLDPTIGSEIRKTRPCVIISPNEIHRHIKTVIIAPMTSAIKQYPTRVACHFSGKDGQVVLDQIRTVDCKRLIKRLGKIDLMVEKEIKSVLHKMFA